MEKRVYWRQLGVSAAQVLGENFVTSLDYGGRKGTGPYNKVVWPLGVRSLIPREWRRLVPVTCKLALEKNETIANHRSTFTPVTVLEPEI